jgi:site-specific DNA recombinase
MKLEAGMLLPWPKPPFGYRSDPLNPRDPAKLKVDEAEAAVVREIFAYYAEEETGLWGLAKHLESHRMPAPGGKKRWNASTIRWILQNPAYSGQVWAGRSRVVSSQLRRSATQPIGSGRSLVTIPRENWIAGARIPAIITQQQFDLVEEKLARNRSFAKRNNKSHQYLLRALVSCGQCGLACVGRWMKGGYSYYRCIGKAHPYQSCKEERCRARFSPANQLDEIVWEDLCEIMSKPEMIAQAIERSQAGEWLPQQLQARRENLRRGRAGLDHQLERLTQAYLAGVVKLEEYSRRRKELEQKGKALDSQQRQLEMQVDRQSEIAGLKASMKEFCQRVRVGLEGAIFEQKRRLVELLIDRVVVKDGDVEIRYVIPTSRRGELTRFCHLRTNYQISHTGQIPMVYRKKS